MAVNPLARARRAMGACSAVFGMMTGVCGAVPTATPIPPPFHQFAWAESFGGQKYDTVRGIVTDRAGNVYTVGTFGAEASISTSGSALGLKSAGGEDGFVIKLASDGSSVWAHELGGKKNDRATAIAMDAESNLYIAGVYAGSSDFRPMPVGAPLTSTADSAAFLLKMDPDGNVLWARGISSLEDSRASGVAVTPAGDVYVCGAFSGTASFEASDATKHTAGGSENAYVWALTKDGNFRWATTVPAASEAYAVAVDLSGFVHVAGCYTNHADFDPSDGELPLNSVENSVDAFAWKLSGAGKFVWARSFGGPGADLAYGIAVDSQDATIITGAFSDSADFDPSPTKEFILPFRGGESDAFVCKLNSGGNLSWAQSYGSPNGFESALAAATDRNGNIYVTGAFQDVTDFDQLQRGGILTSNGSHDCYLVILQPNGKLNSLRRVGSVSPDSGTAVAVDTSGDVLFGGAYRQSMDANPDAGVAYLSSTANADAFIIKLRNESALESSHK
ncbi:hypothetical protein BH09SUM1_BH09SUM1_16420 [soil metagenome]